MTYSILYETNIDILYRIYLSFDLNAIEGYFDSLLVQFGGRFFLIEHRQLI